MRNDIILKYNAFTGCFLFHFASLVPCPATCLHLLDSTSRRTERMRLSNVPILTQEICSSRSWRGTAAVRTASPQSVSCAQRRGYTPVRAMMGTSPLHALLPISVLTDSYKATHFMQYPDTKKMVAVSAPAAIQPITATRRLPRCAVLLFLDGCLRRTCSSTL